MADLPGKHWQAVDGYHIDVRGLQPPEPMIAIIGYIERLDAIEPVIVHHFREPIFLYPELAERQWGHEIVPGDPGEIRVILRKLA
jgi:Uncharacterized conserved protein (DUF2249)